MTPFKPTTEESRNKVQSDIAEILDHFKNHIKHHRPALDIEEVATGEVRHCTITCSYLISDKHLNGYIE